ncbi:chromate efflux transporter [Adhaeribacter radiodurans]|uniref:Chromate efflux transporter n=1 Tax=Adhaeribacter radiodurans TaxID=2745197 RepID=A0A7L7LBA8_9BACT|nr:chromate efflux transporter [Adhaeribacter radiodurans]QMU29689.1 chromate efflux transporter [Adhaeribacter radiodurans]
MSTSISDNPTTTVVKPSFKEAFLFWLKLGFISFGGPAGQIGIMHEFVVDQKKWISDKKFLHALNYCMLLPGPEAQQLATYIGWLLHGTIGGLVAGIFFVLPSVFILLGLSIAYVLFGKIAWVAALFYGLKPAVVAIVILALIKIGKKSLISVFHYVIAALSFIGIFFFDIPFPYLIIGAVLLGWLGKKIYPGLLTQKHAGAQKQTDESGYYLHSGSIIPGTGFSAKRLVFQVAVALLLWAAPFVLFYTSTGVAFWQQLTLFFTKAALVTFGGAYAVLPYVAQVTVEKFNWLSNLQMIDGLALGETTPGPLIMVLAFVGFMAGYNHFQSCILMGSLGLFLTTYYTFLPCFLFILAGAPIIEKTQDNPQVKALLSIVTAAVVGVILNLTIYFALAVVAPQKTISSLDYFSLTWIVVSFLAMYRFKVGMITWIGISALAGLLYYLVSGLVI